MALISRDRAHDAGAVLIPAALVVGAAMATSAIAGVAKDRDYYRAEAARPKPTITKTTTEPAPPPGPSSTTAAATSGAATGSGQPISAAGSASRPGSGEPSGPAPQPAPQSPPTVRGGALVAVRVPLGVLPTARAPLGGSR